MKYNYNIGYVGKKFKPDYRIPKRHETQNIFSEFRLVCRDHTSTTIYF